MKKVIGIYIIMWLIPQVTQAQTIEFNDYNENKIEKHIRKQTNYQGISYTLLDTSVFNDRNDKKMYHVKLDGQMHYLVLSSAKGRTEFFDYFILFTPQLKVKLIGGLRYRSQHGYQIFNKRWLKQFYTPPKTPHYLYGKSVDAISGATYSAKAITNDINEILDKLSCDLH